MKLERLTLMPEPACSAWPPECASYALIFSIDRDRIVEIALVCSLTDNEMRNAQYINSFKRYPSVFIIATESGGVILGRCDCDCGE